jgi:membrane-associated protease RseP (regulator of RpoE activity)
MPPVGDRWPWLLLILVPAAARAVGRWLVARRLGGRLEIVRVGLGPTLLRRTSASGVAWTVGIAPVPLVRVGLVEPEGPGASRRRAALALSGPVAVYLAAAVLVTVTLLARGIERETNVVAAVDPTGPAAGAVEIVDGRAADGPAHDRGLRAGDRIVAVDRHVTQDGRSIRRFLTWVDGDDGEVWVTVVRDGAPREVIVQVHPDAWLLFMVPVAPELGVVLRAEREPSGALAALGQALAFPAAEGSAMRWLAEVVAPRVELHLRDYPVTYAPSLRRRPWPLELADVMGLFAILSLLPWPGLDGGELLLVAYQSMSGGRPPRWFEGLFRSPAWGAAMGVVAAPVSLLWPGYAIDWVFGGGGAPGAHGALFRALFHWAG